MWSSERNLEDVVQGILFLLYNPNLEDPLTCIFSPNMEEDEFKENVKLSLEGACIEGYQFPKPKLRGGDGVIEGEDGIEAREEPDGAEEVHVEGEMKIEDEGDESQTKVKEEVEAINRVNSECKVEVDETVNIVGAECNMIEDLEDEGTPVDPYPYVPQNVGEVKTKIEGNVCVRYERASSLNPISFQRGGAGKVVPGRFNFWWGIAIRRVRSWNVF